MKILISSRSEKALQTLEAHLASSGSYDIEGVLLVNGARDPLRIVDYRPDVLVVHASDHLIEELEALANRAASDRPVIVVVGDELPPEATRYALRAGVRDFVSERNDGELHESIRRLSRELFADEQRTGKLTVVINAKGGSGATFVATSLAHLSASLGNESTAIVDLDFQYASLPQYFDVKPKRDLLDAIASSADLDETAITAYAGKHPSGVDIYAPLPDSGCVVDFNIAERTPQVMRLLKQRYDQVIVDVPRHVDEVSSTVLRSADHIVIVMQQTLLSVHDAVRLKTILVDQLNIPEKRIAVVVNRHSKNASLELKDIEEALDDDDLALIPNHYRLVTGCLDMGELITEEAAHSNVGKALMGLQAKIMGQRPPEHRNFLTKTVMRLRG